MTLEDSINEALELGRNEGFTDMEIGDLIRAEFKRINRPRMTLSRYLPATAKHMEKARPPSKSDFGNKMLPNKSVVVNKPLSHNSTTTTSTTIQQQEQAGGRPGKTNQGPDEYEIERLEEYDAEYLRHVVKWLHETKNELIQGGFKWQARFDEMKREKKALQAENATLKEENAELKKKLGF